MNNFDAFKTKVEAQMGRIEFNRCNHRLNPCGVKGCPKISQIRQKVENASALDQIEEALEEIVCRNTYFGYLFKGDEEESKEWQEDVPTDWI